MKDSFYIAWRYLSFNKLKSLTIVLCITLISALPFCLEVLLGESEHQLMSRAQSTPLVVGEKGSSLDLLMSTLYFGTEEPELISMAAAKRITDTSLSEAIPLYIRFHAQGAPIVGSTFDYFTFRGLEIAEGRNLAMLGECVLGAEVSERLNLKPGDSLISSPESLFDIAGIYPLKMKVVGVFSRANTADDLAVFVDLKTAWVIQGLGHGHQDVTKTTDETVLLKQSEDNVAANAKLVHYNEISEKNINSFHFHGDLSGYPISAVLALPYDEKSSTILQGRFLDRDEALQIVEPEKVIEGLLQTIFKIKNILDAVILIVGFGTILAVFLVFALSLRLRQRELITIFRLGCSRLTTLKMIAAEILIILTLSALCCWVLAWGVRVWAYDLVRIIFIA